MTGNDQAADGARLLFHSPIEELLAMLRHDLRTPVHGILGVLEMLEKVNLDAEHRSLVALAEICGHDLLETLDGILMGVQAETGHLVRNEDWHDLREMIEGVGKVFRPQAELHEIRFDCAVNPGTPRWWRFDRAKLRQILANLLSNALKFTDVGTISLNADVAPGDGALRIRILDTGRGIPADRLKRLFGPFKSDDHFMKGRLPGHGLGLVIVRKLVSMMDGKISVRSVENLGSEVCLQFPWPAREEQPAREKDFDLLDAG